MISRNDAYELLGWELDRLLELTLKAMAETEDELNAETAELS